MATRAQKSDFVSRTQQAVTDLLAAVDRLNALEKTWGAVNMGAELEEEGEDLASIGHAELTVEDVTGAFVALGAINNLLDGQYQRSNLEKLRV